MLKKLVVLGSIFMLCLTMSGCGSKNIEGTLPDLMKKVYKDIKEDEFPMAVENVEITEENVENFLGSKEIEFKEALASESMITATAYSVILLRTKEGADVEKVKQQIKDSINPRKWICVEAEYVAVESKGDLILVIMTNNDLGKRIQKGFQALK